MDSIPLGFRFEPTEEEIIRGFLFPWAIGQPLPWNGIVHRPLYGPDNAPWTVFADGSGYWQTKKEGGQIKTTTYVFTTLVRIKNRISRTAGGGTWGGQTGPKKIFNSETGDTIGVSRMLSFEHPHSGGASSEYGHWIMHEYVFSKEMLKIIPTAGACNMAVCKITRCVKNSGGSGRKPPQQQQQQPQPQFFPLAIADAQQQFFPPAISDVQPQLQMFPQAGGSDNIQVPSKKRGAEEDCFQEVQEDSCKKQKWSGEEGGGVFEVVSIPEAEKEDDSWLLSALEFDENVAKEDDSYLKSVILEFNEDGEKKEDDSRIISGLELNEENVAKEDDSWLKSVILEFDEDDEKKEDDSRIVSGIELNQENVAKGDDSRDESDLDQEFDDYFDFQSLLGRRMDGDQL